LEPRAVPAVVVPPDFVNTTIATGIKDPTGMDIAPDGRIFVAEQGGTIRIVENGTLLPTPFATIPVGTGVERGIEDVELDPNFARNGYVYVFASSPSAPFENDVIRLTAAGDVAAPGSQVTLFRVLAPDQSQPPQGHIGGAMHFGLDGKLYVAVGDHGLGSNAQTLTNLAGKMLRLNPDGTIPTDNPFYNATTGVNRAIWALGLRNPFTFSVQPGTGRIFINDVGEDTWEEIDEGKPGANYGWPFAEGPSTNPAFTNPIYAYQHGPNDIFGSAITGGTFYNPSVPSFPAPFVGDYLFSDFGAGYIKIFNPSTGAVTPLAGNIGHPIDLAVDAQGSLYYLAWAPDATASIGRIQFAPTRPPAVLPAPASVTVAAGQPATFAAQAAGAPTLSFQWQVNGANIPGATGPTYTLPATDPSFTGARFRAVVSNAYGSTTGPETVLKVTSTLPPSATILVPGAGSTYTPNGVVAFGGTASDPQDGPLAPSALTWQAALVHNNRVIPLLAPTPGIAVGSFAVPTASLGPGAEFVVIALTATDSSGRSTTVARVLLPANTSVSGSLAPGSTLVGAGVSHATSSHRPRFVGQASPGSVVSLFAADSSGRVLSLGQSTANRGGAWSLTSTAFLSNGPYQIFATAANASGVSAPPAPLWSPDTGPLVVQAGGS
jgi:glucose/arabinose dehydrogenase